MVMHQVTFAAPVFFNSQFPNSPTQKHQSEIIRHSDGKGKDVSFPTSSASWGIFVPLITKGPGFRKLPLSTWSRTRVQIVLHQVAENRPPVKWACRTSTYLYPTTRTFSLTDNSYYFGTRTTQQLGYYWHYFRNNGHANSTGRVAVFLCNLSDATSKRIFFQMLAGEIRSCLFWAVWL